MRGLFRGLLFCVLAVGACRPTPPLATGPGHFEVRWQGARDGSISGTASATWCAVRKVLEIRIVQGDTGIALALYPAKDLAAGVYRVVEPAKAESVPPAAGVAVRWPSQTIVQGFQGDSGLVQLERSDTNRFSGNLSARARSVVDTQRIRLSGRFRDLEVKPDTRGCPSADSAVVESGQDAEPGDTSVH